MDRLAGYLSGAWISEEGVPKPFELEQSFMVSKLKKLMSITKQMPSKLIHVAYVQSGSIEEGRSKEYETSLRSDHYVCIVVDLVAQQVQVWDSLLKMTLANDISVRKAYREPLPKTKVVSKSEQRIPSLSVENEEKVFNKVGDALLRAQDIRLLDALVLQELLPDVDASLLSMHKWPIVLKREADVPQQRGVIQCGSYALMAALTLGRTLPWTNDPNSQKLLLPSQLIKFTDTKAAGGDQVSTVIRPYLSKWATHFVKNEMVIMNLLYKDPPESIESIRSNRIVTDFLNMDPLPRVAMDPVFRITTPAASATPIPTPKKQKTAQ